MADSLSAVMLEGGHQSCIEYPMPQMFDIAGRRPTRLAWLYELLLRACSPLHQAFWAWGTTPEDHAMSWPCDSHIEPPRVGYYRGVEVMAPPEIVYRWLCQIRVAPYSYDLFDNFGRRSPQRLTPGLSRLAVGQPLLVMFRIVEFEENEHITVVSETYKWLSGQKLAMTYRVLPCTPTSCRIVSKLVVHNGPDTYLNRLRREYTAIGELPLMRKQLLSMKRLAEKQSLEQLAGRRHLPDDRLAVGPRKSLSVGELVAQSPDGE